MTRAEFVGIAEALQIYYPREKLFETERAVELWFRELEEFTREAVEKAMRHWVRTERWCPSIADLRRLAEKASQNKPLDMEKVQDQRRSLEELRRRAEADRREVSDA